MDREVRSSLREGQTRHTLCAHYYLLRGQCNDAQGVGHVGRHDRFPQLPLRLFPRVLDGECNSSRYPL